MRSCPLSVSTSVLPILIAGSMLAVGPAHAGPVTGRVVDPSGRPVPAAQVLLTAPGTGIRLATTDALGEFSLQAPDSGRLELRVAVEGFRVEPVVFDATADARSVGDLRLSIAALSESVVVSAAQVETPLSETSASVTVMTGAELRDRQMHTVADALRLVPGMAVAASGGLGAVTGVFPRGGESDYTLVFIDGVQANGFGGEFDFAHLSTANVERIEVVRGPQSALFGSNAIGSVVRIVTRRGGPAAASGLVEGGSQGTGRWSAATSGGRGPIDWGGAVEALRSDGRNGERTAAGEEIRNDDYARHSIAGSIGWTHGSGATLRGDARYANDERGFPGPFGTNPIGAFTGIDTVSRGDYDRVTAGVSGAIPVGDRWRAQVQIGYNRTAGDFASPSFVDPSGPPATSESSSRRWSGRAQADGTVARRLDASLGFERLVERAGSTYITGIAGQPIPVERSVTALFAEARWRTGERLFVTGGVRVDDIRREALEASADPFSPRPAMPAESIVSVNPKMSAAWFVRRGAGTHTRLRGAIGTGIRPPDGFEIAFTDNPSLEPERSTSAEAAIDQAVAGGRLLLEATAFFNDYDDLIVAVGSFAESSRYRTDNIANARARGLELAGTGRTRLGTATPIDIEARVAYTWLDTEVLAVDRADSAPPPFTVGDPLIRRPRHQFSLDLSATTGRLTAYLRGGGRGRTLDVEPSYGTFGGLFEAAGYAVWHAGASWRLTRGLELFGRVDNIADRTYEEALGYPAPGRGAFAGLRIAAGR